MQESHTIAQLQWKRKCTDTYRQQQQQQQQPLFTPYMNTTSGVCMKQNQNSQRRSQIITMKYENKKHRHRWWPRNWVQINRRYRVDRRIISAWGWNQVKIKKKYPALCVMQILIFHRWGARGSFCEFFVPFLSLNVIISVDCWCHSRVVQQCAYSYCSLNHA